MLSLVPLPPSLSLSLSPLSLSLSSIVYLLQERRRESIEEGNGLQMIAGRGHAQDPGLDLEKGTRRKRNSTWTLMMSQVSQIVRLIQSNNYIVGVLTWRA